jgi:hypothetical protein
VSAGRRRSALPLWLLAGLALTLDGVALVLALAGRAG